MRLARACLIALALLLPAACRARGREVFIREGCVNCHRFRDLGGGPGPDLSFVGSRMSAAEVRAKIAEPSAGNPASRMPPFPRISWFDLRSLVRFLRS